MPHREVLVRFLGVNADAHCDQCLAHRLGLSLSEATETMLNLYTDESAVGRYELRAALCSVCLRRGPVIRAIREQARDADGRFVCPVCQASIVEGIAAPDNGRLTRLHLACLAEFHRSRRPR